MSTQAPYEPTAVAEGSVPRGIEANGVNAIDESERKGSPRQLFWPWFAANVSVLGIGYGAYLLFFGVSFWQAVIVGALGIVISFLFCGFIALAGKRGNAPTMTLGRAAFGVNGNKVPSIISWVLTVGWETALTSLAVLATATVFEKLGAGGGDVTKVIALIVVAALVVFGGILGFDFLMRLQKWITVATGVLTVVYIVLTFHRIDFHAVMALPSGALPAVIGGFVFMMTGFGLGWVNAAADYSRYLPRKSSSGGVIWWTTFGSSIAPVILLVFGLLLAGSSKSLFAAINDDPIGALATLVPTWFLIPFALVAILGLVGGSVMNIYSSGFSLLNAGLKIPRYAAASVDGVVMIAGTIYVAFFATSFVVPFQGFLITLGVPIAAWAGIFLADVQLRRKDYATADLFDKSGRYGSVQWVTIGLIVLGTIIGWGLVENGYASWLGWQGYFLFGLKAQWGGANLGVLAALLIGYLGTILFMRPVIRQQEGVLQLDRDIV
ncbi:allantoin permease [Frondihabitans sp. PAMC 28766]|uniref:purine-cytosine permease family protein n=1 Tax=Frondihabitans sp. PAMC 28766 TaxID=1795630 RepID=UPI00078E0530|nr:cytosine permease [Frondihabitans sp. PAMC 28766]AMM20392.1 allantoin permease [Frondihabitans sp. PAMC 28766]